MAEDNIYPDEFKEKTLLKISAKFPRTEHHRHLKTAD